MFQWSKREFGRVCVRLELDKQLSLGVWVEGPNGRFYQNVEYERISSLCFNYGIVGHLSSTCGARSVVDGSVQKEGNCNVEGKKFEASQEEPAYGPWIHVNNRKKSWFNQRKVRQTNSNPVIKGFKQIFKKKLVQEISQVANA
ncbi:hypothetical protein MA16_Dca008173 [Dendrobium catenatum]|uniref:DUF4283 domain-containing protein n=1 Tax=Dendrobium catenatum TaxID=906689 RepID=A0A2I0XA29_9ASPA|nr:hypothetical protein MA16_Dca008173 [Dendrobium catenatum]